MFCACGSIITSPPASMANGIWKATTRRFVSAKDAFDDENAAVPADVPER
jgi:hypothetical protein